jgi:hypothetical protein
MVFSIKKVKPSEISLPLFSSTPLGEKKERREEKEYGVNWKHVDLQNRMSLFEPSYSWTNNNVTLLSDKTKKGFIRKRQYSVQVKRRK